jgi:hypothetical protein
MLTTSLLTATFYEMSFRGEVRRKAAESPEPPGTFMLASVEEL